MPLKPAPSVLPRSFRSALGCSVWQYVARQRVPIASGSKIDAALSLTKIAAMSGFERYSSFAATFKAS
ncbi:helix-turn-helix domain-containing protein [Silvibacterium bohemicum]|uniref:helix-turn-helix domain-containing protein n=1 Tax=Silvibacterium bohemicum TaxID=1577686 RepID=UPI00161322EB